MKHHFNIIINNHFIDLTMIQLDYELPDNATEKDKALFEMEVFNNFAASDSLEYIGEFESLEEIINSSLSRLKEKNNISYYLDIDPEDSDRFRNRTFFINQEDDCFDIESGVYETFSNTEIPEVVSINDFVETHDLSSEIRIDKELKSASTLALNSAIAVELDYWLPDSELGVGGGSFEYDEVYKAFDAKIKAIESEIKNTLNVEGAFVDLVYDKEIMKNFKDKYALSEDKEFLDIKVGKDVIKLRLELLSEMSDELPEKLLNEAFLDKNGNKHRLGVNADFVKQISEQVFYPASKESYEALKMIVDENKPKLTKTKRNKP